MLKHDRSDGLVGIAGEDPRMSPAAVDAYQHDQARLGVMAQLPYRRR
ncbi:hypothetical protein [Nonomuraea typhae]|nr:hypothetical protein [Nonomuraea typhae]